MSIGKNIKAQREHRNFNQAELAQKAHITQGQLSDYENDKVKPMIDKLGQIADALGVSVAVLDENLLNVAGFGNSINHSHIGGDVTQTVQHQSADAVETFRAGLIAKIILLDGDAATKDAVLKVIATFGKTE